VFHRLKAIARDITPPIVMRRLRPYPLTVDPIPGPAPNHGFFGDYPSFAAALAASNHYDAPAVAKRVADSLAAFQTFSLPHFIDSRIQQIHSVFTMLDQDDLPLSVLDVGGAAGVYFHYLRLLSPRLPLNWTVLELPGIVEAVRNIPSPVTFVDQIERADRVYDVALASGSLQYFEDPAAGIKTCFEKGKRIILNRMPVTAEPEHTIRVQKVPPHLHEASMPVWFFSEDRLIECIRQFGSIDLAWDVAADENTWAQGGAIAMRGYLCSSAVAR